MTLKFSFFDIYLLLITISKVIGLSADDQLYQILFALGIIFLAFEISYTKWSRKELLILGGLTFLGILNVVLGNSTALFLTIITFWGAKQQPFRKSVNIIFWTMLVAFTTIYLGSISGFLPNHSLEFYRNGQFIYRYSFIYDHPNIAHLIFSLIIFLGYYLYRQKLGWIASSVILAINYFLYQLTFSRTGFLLVVLYIFIELFYRYSVTFKKIYLQVAHRAYIIFFIVSLFLAYAFGRFNFATKVDQVLTGRVYYLSRIFTEYRPTLFGQNQYVDILIDNGYVALLYGGGLVLFLVFSYYIVKVSNILYNKQYYDELILLSIFCIYTMTESFFPSVSLNISLLLIPEVIFNRTCKKLNK